jgi:hypothetical protein
VGKHRKPTRNWAPYVSAGLALEAAALLGVAYAGDGHIPGAELLATSIFVDGTKSLTGNELGNPPFRMADSLQGNYSDGAGTDYDEQFVIYPRSLGPATGVGDPTYDVSEGLATEQVVELVKAAKTENPGQKIFVVGYSQGAGGAVKAIPELEEQGLSDDVEFVLAANPRRNDGGILTRLPAGVYVPVFGVTFGDGTTPVNTKILQVTKQYDGVGDAPKYFLNVVADANAALGFYYLHGDYYKDIDPTPDPTRTDAIVSTTADGKVTDVLVLNQAGQLPLTRPLLQLGIPQNIVTALDPFLRAVIETGYDRPSGPGSYPSEPVPFQLVPPPTKLLSDVQSVAAGAALTSERLAALGQPAPAISPSTTSLTGRSAPPPTDPEEADPVKPPKDDEQLAGNATNKAEPPKPHAGGWKPGDVLRSSFAPKPKGETTKDAAPSEPPPTQGTQGTNDPAPANDTDSESSDSPSE